jgi:hypothetical protein
MKTVDVMALNQHTAFTVHLIIEKNFYYYLHVCLSAHLQFCFVEDIGVEPMTLPTYESGCIYPTDLTLTPRFGGGYRSRTDDPLRARQML